MSGKRYQLLAIAACATAAITSALPARSLEPARSGGLAQCELGCSEAAAKADAAELVSIPGTSLALSPPEGFVLSEQFSGFINPDTRSSIVLTELPPEAYPELAALFSAAPDAIAEAFASRGIALQVEAVSNISAGDAQAPFVEGTQSAGGLQVRKYFTLLSGERTILLTFNVIEGDPLSKAAVVETVRSVNLASAASLQESLASLPFTFQTAPPFQVVQTLAGSSVLLSPSGEPDASGTEPFIVIASSVSPVETFDLAAFSSQLLQETRGFTEANIIAQTPIDFAGGEGYLTRATLQDAAVLQYFAILPDGFYIRLLVQGNAEALETLTPAIQFIQESIEVR